MASTDDLRTISLDEVKQHTKDGDAWVVVDGFVYDVSSFATLHPGGRQVLLRACGTDATDDFRQFHHPDVLKKYQKRLLIGRLEGSDVARFPPPPGTFGDMIPYGDPAWYQRFNSPYHKETHRQWRQYVREFFEAEVFPRLDEMTGVQEPPRDLLEKMGAAGLLAVLCGPPYPREYAPESARVPEDFDYFHEMIVYDELARTGRADVVAALTNGPAIGLSAVLSFGTEEQKRRVAPDVLAGRKMMALAISEPHAGSDVAGMVCTAEPAKTASGQRAWRLNGNKKWITNGTYADCFSVACRTGPKPMDLSFFLVERDNLLSDQDTFSTRKVAIRDSDLSGTAYLDFDECLIPWDCLIGEVNGGFKLIMYNFNHERLYVSAVMARMSRVCLEESIRYALIRKAFGKKLSDLQAIRLKIARMIQKYQTWFEYVLYQMCTMTHEEANMKMGDVVCLLKAQGSEVYEFCAREATMIFGGNSLYLNGVGRKIEPAVAQVKAYHIPAGAVDVMLDFGARAAFKQALMFAKL